MNQEGSVATGDKKGKPKTGTHPENDECSIMLGKPKRRSRMDCLQYGLQRRRMQESFVIHGLMGTRKLRNEVAQVTASL